MLVELPVGLAYGEFEDLDVDDVGHVDVVDVV